MGCNTHALGPYPAESFEICCESEVAARGSLSCSSLDKVEVEASSSDEFRFRLNMSLI